MQTKNADKVKDIQESARDLQRATKETARAERWYHSQSMTKASTQIKDQKGELEAEAAAKQLLTLFNNNLQKCCAGKETTSAARLEKMKVNYDSMAGYRQDVEESREEIGELQQTLHKGRILYRQLERKLEASVAAGKEIVSALQEEVAAGKEALLKEVAAGKVALEEAVVAGNEAVEVRTVS